jgi:hypothetical protein
VQGKENTSLPQKVREMTVTSSPSAPFICVHVGVGFVKVTQSKSTPSHTTSGEMEPRRHMHRLPVILLFAVVVALLLGCVVLAPSESISFKLGTFKFDALLY